MNGVNPRYGTLLSLQYRVTDGIRQQDGAYLGILRAIASSPHRRAAISAPSSTAPHFILSSRRIAAYVSPQKAGLRRVAIGGDPPFGYRVWSSFPVLAKMEPSSQYQQDQQGYPPQPRLRIS